MNKKVFLGWVTFFVFWFLFMFHYVSNTDESVRAHDYDGHFYYLSVVTNEHRLPIIKEGWETHQPPIYYVLTNAFKFFGGDHHFISRMFSVVLGMIFLITLILFLRGMLIRHFYIFPVILLVATTPSFVFMFGSYNNDTLSVCMSGLYIFVSQWFFSTRKILTPFVLLIFIGLIGLYTKFSILAVFICCSLAVVLLSLFGKLSKAKTLIYVVGTIILGVSFLPWAIFKTYSQTGEFMFVNCDDLRLWGSYVDVAKALFYPPFFQNGILATPWYSSEKRINYWIFRFSTSIFEQTNLSSFMWGAWVIFWAHVFFVTNSIKNAINSKIIRLCLFLVFVTTIISLPMLFRCEVWNQFNYRLFSWVTFLWGICYSINIKISEKDKFSFWTQYLLFIFCAMLQVRYIFLAFEQFNFSYS